MLRYTYSVFIYQFEEVIIMEAHCLRCKVKREMVDEKEVVWKNGRRAMKGKCKVCGAGMSKILGMK